MGPVALCFVFVCLFALFFFGVRIVFFGIWVVFVGVCIVFLVF